MNRPKRNDAVPSLLRRINVRRVLEVIQQHGPLSRAELSRTTGISPPTMSLLVKQLQDSGLLEPDPLVPDGAAGRPAIRFRLATESAHVIGAVVDINQCTVLMTGLDGVIDPTQYETFATPKRYETLINRLARHVESVRSLRNGTCLGIGLSVPGLVDQRKGQVRFSPNLRFLDGHCPGADLKAALGQPVITCQEEHALSLAVQLFGKARGCRDFILIDVSAGLGMGVFTNGMFLTGREGYAGEIGHMTVEPDGRQCGCGNRGCLETVATDKALAAAYSASWGRPVEIDEVIESIRTNRHKAGKILDETLDYLAIGVAAAINIFNPERVLLHGRLFDIQDDAIEQLQEKVRRRALGPALESCDIIRTSANKPQAAVAAIIQHVCMLHGT